MSVQRQAVQDEMMRDLGTRKALPESGTLRDTGGGLGKCLDAFFPLPQEARMRTDNQRTMPQIGEVLQEESHILTFYDKIENQGWEGPWKLQTWPYSVMLLTLIILWLNLLFLQNQNL